MKKIGIMGGTFDPIHVGHLMIAEAVWDEFKLDKVIFIPSANPPHKHSVMTSAKHRFNMTLLATCSNPHFEVSSIEMERSGPSYTIDTIKALKTIYGEDTDFYFIIGGDMISGLAHWAHIDELLELVQFVGIRRPRYRAGTSYPIMWVDVPMMDISGNLIREQLHRGIKPHFLLVPKVLDYILKEGLYV